MSQAAIESDDELPRTWSQSALPWLMSAAAHLSLLLLLALSITRTFTGSAKYGRTMTGTSLEVHVVSRGLDDADHQGEGPLQDAGVPELNGGSSNAANATSPPPGVKQFFDDEGEPPPATATGATGPALAMVTPGGLLRKVLSDGPPVDVTSVLPGTGNLPGVGRTGAGGEGVVGTAGQMTQSSQRGGGSKKLRGGYARTGVFGAVGEGHKFAYVFDRSGSMDGHGGLPLAMAKSELLSSLRDLGDTHQFQIIFYNEHPRIFNLSGSPGRLVFGSQQNKALAQKFVGGITADGGTEHEEALMMALRLAPDVIFFLTDADEPRMTPQQLARIERMNPGTTINAIEFGYGPQTDANNFLVQLAHRNAGNHVYIDVAEIGRQRKP